MRAQGWAAPNPAGASARKGRMRAQHTGWVPLCMARAREDLGTHCFQALLAAKPVKSGKRGKGKGTSLTAPLPHMAHAGCRDAEMLPSKTTIKLQVRIPRDTPTSEAAVTVAGSCKCDRCL